MIKEITLSLCENSGTDTCPDSKFPPLEHTDDVLLSENPSKQQILLDYLDDDVVFGMGFAPSR